MGACTIRCILTVLFGAVNYGFAQVWTQTAAPGGIGEAASSADGSKLVAEGNSKIYASTNSGANWMTNNIPFQDLGVGAHIALSADGNKLVLASYGTSVFTSMNAGETWITNYVTALPWTWTSVASSADGRVLVAAKELVSFHDHFYFKSTNSGVTWFSIGVPPIGDFDRLVLSADGSQLAAANNGGIYTSTDSGVTWISNNAPKANWVSIAMSADGSKLVAGSNIGIYSSTDFGVTWISNNVPGARLYFVSSSADGDNLVAANGAGIFTSTNSGVTWISNNVPSASWSLVASSADGCKKVAGDYNLGIWTVQTKPTPRLNLLVSASSFTFSWTVPSINFVLQQNLDLTTTNWVTLTNSPVVNFANLNNELNFSLSNGSGFYRLVSP